MLERGEITAGHARTLLSFKTEEGMRLGAQKAKDGASVRELEALAKRLNEKKEIPAQNSPEKPVFRGGPAGGGRVPEPKGEGGGQPRRRAPCRSSSMGKRTCRTCSTTCT